VNCILNVLISGKEKVMFSKMTIANSVKYSCFYDDRRE
jgi:hypothetical protein